MNHGYCFKEYLCLKENKENFDQPHIISADPPMKLPSGIERLAEAFKKSKEVPIGKEVDPKMGGEKHVTMKGRKLFIVGGAVRDYLLGHTPKNYNLVTDAHPDEVEKICTHSKPPITVIKRNKDSVRISVEGENYEIETMKLPNNEFTTNPQEDVNRRDLTSNSLYYEISAKKILDFTGGIRHIKDGHVKFIGNPEERIKEDGTRKYRYARMLNKIPNAQADDEVKIAISKNMDSGESPDKIREEFWKGMEDLHTNAGKYLKTYEDLDLLQTVFPKLELSFDFPNSKSKPIVLACLLKNNPPRKLVTQLKELKYTDREIKDAVFLINLLLFKPEYFHDFKRQLIQTNLTKRQIIEWAKLNHLDIDGIEKLMAQEITF